MAFQPLSHDDLLALWRTLFPASYTRPLETESDGLGADYVHVQASQMSRAAAGADTTFGAIYLRPHSDQTAPPAAGAARAATTVLVARAAPTLGDITLIAGVELRSLFHTPQGGVIEGPRFVVAEDTRLAAGSLGPFSVPVVASRVGFAGNVPAGSIADFAPRGTASVVGATVLAGNVLRDNAGASGGDRITPQMIGQYVRLVGGVNGGTTARRIVSVTQPTVTDPYAYAVLDGAALVAPDTLTRADVVEFADLGLSVTQPADAAGGVDGFLDAIGDERNMPRQLGEGDDAYRLRLSSLADIVSPGAIARIASRILSPFGIPWKLVETRDTGTLIGLVWDYHAFDYGSVTDGVVFAPPTRYFAIVVGTGNQGEFGFPYDSTALGLTNAYDAPGGAHDFYDGFPVGYYSAISALWATVDRARAAGVAWDLILDPTL